MGFRIVARADAMLASDEGVARGRHLYWRGGFVQSFMRDMGRAEVFIDEDEANQIAQKLRDHYTGATIKVVAE